MYLKALPQYPIARDDPQWCYWCGYECRKGQCTQPDKLWRYTSQIDLEKQLQDFYGSNI